MVLEPDPKMSSTRREEVLSPTSMGLGEIGLFILSWAVLTS